MRYGKYELRDGQFSFGDTQITLTKRNDSLIEYLRKSPNSEKKLLFSTKGSLIVEPFPPVFLPKKITSFILLEFESGVMVEPSGTSTFYTSFPVENGVIVAGKNDVEVVDVFSEEKPKYTLYGTIEQGVICRYCRAPVEFEPEKKSDHAVVKMSIKNRYREWVNVTKAVIDCNALNIFYSESSIRASNVTMEIQNREVATVRAEEKPPERNLTRAVSLKQLEARVLQPKKVVEGKKFTMWWGY